MKEGNQNKLPQKKPYKSFIQYSGMAFQMLIVILIGVYLGNLIDTKLEMTKPIFTMILHLRSSTNDIYSGIVIRIRILAPMDRYNKQGLTAEFRFRIFLIWLHTYIIPGTGKNTL